MTFIYQFSWRLLRRVATHRDDNDLVYPVNSCFTQIFDRTILSVTIFPQRCAEFPDNFIHEFSMFREIPDYMSRFSRFVATLTPCVEVLVRSRLFPGRRSERKVEEKQVLQQEAYPATRHRVDAQNSAIPGAIRPTIGEDLSQIRPNHRAKFHADR